MFENKNLFGMFEEIDGMSIKKIKVNRDTQNLVTQHFSNLYENLDIPSKERITFNGSYKVDPGQINEIANFNLNTGIIEAITNPVAEEAITNREYNINKLKYVFIGEVVGDSTIIVFQLIQKSQHLSNEGLKLLLNNGTFESVGKTGFSITSKLEAVFLDGKLLFESYWYARRIFDLKDYYREATDDDVRNFAQSDLVVVENQDQFYDNADSFVRRKIALIEDSRVLHTYTANIIKEKAAEYSVDIRTVSINGMETVSLPSDKKELKEVLKFLDEDIYKGPLTNKTYETNSKMVKS